MLSARRVRIAVVAAAVLTTASLALAQRIWSGRGWFGEEPPRWASPEHFDGSFNYCRVFYQSSRGEPGGMGWWTDYPGADNNFSVRLAELTKIRVRLDADGQPDHVVVRLNDPLLYECPRIFMEDVGTAALSDEEAAQLRDYLLKGGFLWVDDFWGTAAWNQWVREIAHVLPPVDYPIEDIPASDPIRHTLYDFDEVLQAPSIQSWYRLGGTTTSERGADSAHANFRGIRDRQGRLMVIMTHNTDIADTWEREGENHEYFLRFSPEGYGIGINIVLYAMTH